MCCQPNFLTCTNLFSLQTPRLLLLLFICFVLCLLSVGASMVAQRLKCVPTMTEIWVRSLGREDPLEKEMATHSSILAWRIPRTEEPGGLQFTGRKESDRTERLHFHFHFHFIVSSIYPCIFLLSAMPNIFLF